MGRKSIVINLAATELKNVIGLLSKEEKREEEKKLYNITYTPFNTLFRRHKMSFLKEGEHFIKKNIDGSVLYIIFRDSEGRSELFDCINEEIHGVISQKSQALIQKDTTINHLKSRIKSLEESEDIKEFKKNQMMRASNNDTDFRRPEEYNSLYRGR